MYRIGHYLLASGPISLKMCIDKLDLPDSEKFRFHQISHFLHTIWKVKSVPLVCTPYEQWCGQATEQKGGISLIYEALSTPTSKLTYMTEWERDLGESWDLEIWNRMNTRAYKGMVNIALIEANTKVLTRWYLVPSKLALMFPSSSPLCFRNCQAQGTVLHIWWECPKIRGFWNGIFHLIRKITDTPIPKSPQIALLNGNIPKISKTTAKLIAFILTGAKISIAKAWKQPGVSLASARRKISWIMSQENLVSTIADSNKAFLAVWEPWARHVGISLTPGVEV